MRENEVVRLPLWKSCVDKMRFSGMHYGQEFSAEFFEENLRCARIEMQFALAISQIRRELEKDGLYLSGRGGGGNQYVILRPETNAEIMAGYSRRAADALKRGVILGTNTRLDTLKESDRRKHEGLLERMAIKVALISRAGQVAKLVKKNQPELLRQNAPAE